MKSLQWFIFFSILCFASTQQRSYSHNNCCKYKEVGGIYYDLIITYGFMGNPYSLSCINPCFYRSSDDQNNFLCFGSGNDGSGFEAHCLDNKKTTFPLSTMG
eukprot:GFUD01077704.1.p1 GENE.GFUD01077704.1~~GFUD01077704.1.p1  ORF type:complete len:110 (+),score=11.93 GFUD01077704.1:26-331(+)